MITMADEKVLIHIPDYAWSPIKYYLELARGLKILVANIILKNIQYFNS